MKKILAFFCAAMVLAACNNLPDNPNVTEEEMGKGIKELKMEVMAVHDTAMKKMGIMGNLQKQLKDTWGMAKDSLPYMQAYNELAEAHDDMMAWMRNFEIPRQASDDEKQSYLLEEKKVINAVNAEMDKAIEEARFLLENRDIQSDMENPEVELME